MQPFDINIFKYKHVNHECDGCPQLDGFTIVKANSKFDHQDSNLSRSTPALEALSYKKLHLYEKRFILNSSA